MGNSSTSFLPAYSCFDSNLSRNLVTPEYWDSYSINDDFKNSSIAIAVIVLLFFLIGLPSNVVIIVSIIQQKLYKEPTHILLLNLAISDFLVCLLIMPMVIVAGFAGGYIFGDSDYVRCQVCQSGLIIIALTLISMYNIGFLSVDRFIFFKFPLRYSRYITVPRVIVMVTSAWILSVSAALIPLSGFGEIKYSYTTSACIISFLGRAENIYYIVFALVLNLIPVVVTVITNVWIACLARKEIGNIYRIRKSSSNDQQLKIQKINMQKALQRKRNKKQLVLIRVFGAILIACFVVWMPLVIFFVVWQLVDDNNIPLGIYVLVYLCLILHSVLHPLMEGCFIPEIKRTFKNVLGITCCEKNCKKKRKDGPNKDSTVNEDNTLDDGSVSCWDICSLAVLPANPVSSTH